VTIVMGLDQHRAQITAEWLDTETGEVSRARVMPADRAGVQRFLARFAGQRLEVALEATTGWRFVVEELRAVGAEPHLAEPAEASALKGNKKRAKTDRGDARHLRELLMTGRLPESYPGRAEGVAREYVGDEVHAERHPSKADREHERDATATATRRHAPRSSGRNTSSSTDAATIADCA
jgi:hypothetical protein